MVYLPAPAKINLHQLPANGVPKIPTASSAQIRKKAIRIIAQIISRLFRLFTFLNTNSHIRPVPSNSRPIMIKSNGDQFTSFVNCIVINGISKRNAAASTIPIRRLFCVSIRNLLISKIIKSTLYFKVYKKLQYFTRELFQKNTLQTIAEFRESIQNVYLEQFALQMTFVLVVSLKKSATYIQYVAENDLLIIYLMVLLLPVSSPLFHF